MKPVPITASTFFFRIDGVSMADAIMDRLVNNSIHIELKGESMRRKKKK